MNAKLMAHARQQAQQAAIHSVFGPPRYDATAVQAAIDASNRSGQKIGRVESRLIHALLRGRD
jgi:hypothetical protein